MAWSTKDEYTPALELIIGKFGDRGRKEAFRSVGYMTKARLKRFMQNSLGFGNERPYAPLKIKFRYHGRKTLVGGSTVSKTPVTSASKPLIDGGDFRRAWEILQLKPGDVVLGCDEERFRKLAFIHGNTTYPRRIIPERGNWDWSGKSADFVQEVYLKHFDEDVFE